MVGEMHQIYLLANVLEMSKVKLSCIPTWMSLETGLNILSVVIGTIFLTYQSAETQIFVHPFRYLWTLIVSLIQINIISTAKRLPASQKEHDVISNNDTSILCSRSYRYFN